MPVLGPEYQTFERVRNGRLRAIEAKERAAVQLAHGTLEPTQETPAPRGIAAHIGRILSRKHAPTERRTSVIAFYEPNDDASEAGSEPTMSAHFSSVMGGVLFTQSVRLGEGPIESRFSWMEPRAILAKEGFMGSTIVAIDVDGNPVYPDSMTLDDRERFVDEVSETISIIHSQSHLVGRHEARAASSHF